MKRAFCGAILGRLSVHTMYSRTNLCPTVKYYSLRRYFWGRIWIPSSNWRVRLELWRWWINVKVSAFHTDEVEASCLPCFTVFQGPALFWLANKIRDNSTLLAVYPALEERVKSKASVTAKLPHKSGSTQTAYPASRLGSPPVIWKVLFVLELNRPFFIY